MASATPPSDLDRLTRFACFGSEDGTYNVIKKNDFSKEGTGSIDSILTSKEKSLEAVARLKKIFQQTCYSKKEPLIYALARIVRNSPIPEGDKHVVDEVRENAYLVTFDVCGTAEELFTFVDFDKRVAVPPKVGWGRGMRDMVKSFYESRSAQELLKEVTRCKSGKGFSHKDLIRLSHVNPERKSKGMAAVVAYVLQGRKAMEEHQKESDEAVQEVLGVVRALESLCSSDPLKEDVIRSVIQQHSFRGRQIPSWCYQYAEAFEALLEHMSLEEVIRAVPKMASLGMLDPKTEQCQRIIDRLQDKEAIERDRLNPVMIFSCMKKYETNRAKKWVRNQDVVNAFSVAYETSLKTLPRMGKRHLLAVHISSKVTKLRVIGSSTLSPIMPCAVMAQLLAEAEDSFEIVFFHTQTSPLNIEKGMHTVAIVEQILRAARDPANQSSDLCQPLQWAASNGKVFDNILILTDKKVVQTPQTLVDNIRQYRSTSQQEAKVAVIGLSDMIQFPNADDLNYLDISGFDETVPGLVRKFFEGYSEPPAPSEKQDKD
ncbi:60 kDa SS-A/Ro ribonucleoprotein [Aplysia californica]|uniref:60 kDa SS-A/Ro ribonucleoprotein n=1 Tax=Aplysia californica TaxID=6500 RepID=A0ABM0JWL8_APLCA|nr:60 kDa SS-A/Ro ribonucleoprotein [Aplysia californica]